MSSVVVRIPRETHDWLRHMAESRHESVGTIVAELVQSAEEQQFWEKAQQSVAAAMANPDIRKAMEEEQRIYDGTLMDGLEPETWPDE